MACYSLIGVVSTGGYIIADLFMIMERGRIACDDYIMGALTLYLDTVRMFMYLLRLFGRLKKK